MYGGALIMEKRKINREMTKQLLTETYGIFYDPIIGGYRQNCCDGKQRNCTVFMLTQKKKYGKTLRYEILSVRDPLNAKLQRTIPYHRFLYAFYKGDIPDGYQVDHIDNDHLNNSLDNLQLLTQAENLKKRGGGCNQYTAVKKYGGFVSDESRAKGNYGLNFNKKYKKKSAKLFEQQN